MESASPHQCFVYEGAPSRHLPAIAQMLCDKLKQNYRCLYLNSPPMVAGVRSYLAALGTDVIHETTNMSLVLSSEQQHLREGNFDVDAMMQTLEEALQQALCDGYEGLWATGDMTWEFGPRKDFSRLLEYEWRLEEFFETHPQIGGICQYHADTLPGAALRQGLTAHRSLFLNETLTLLNPYYVRPEAFTSDSIDHPELEEVLSRLCWFDDRPS